MSLLDKIPMQITVIMAIFLGLSPFVPEPHLFEKLRMLVDGTLVKPIDIVDLVFHGTPSVILVAKLLRLRNGAGKE
jgi:hypothetical protein